jgi:transposase
MACVIRKHARPDKYPAWYVERCIYYWWVEGKSQTDVASIMGCERHAVARFVARWHAGEPLQAPGQTGSLRGCRTMNPTMVDDMLELVRRRNDLFLPEIAQELYQLHGVMPSVWQVCRALRANGITRKKVRVAASCPHRVRANRRGVSMRGALTALSLSQLHKRAQEAQVELQEAFKELVMHVPLERLFFIDESAVVRLPCFNR